MKIWPITTQDSSQRLEWLARLEILDSSCKAQFEEVVLTAAAICQTPIVLVSLIDRNRQWFKAQFGFGSQETGLDMSICAKAIEHEGVFVVTNAEADPRVNSNPLVYGQPSIQFYAGAPLIVADGTAIGMVCVLDTKVREEGVSPVQDTALKELARRVMFLLEHRPLRRPGPCPKSAAQLAAMLCG